MYFILDAIGPIYRRAGRLFENLGRHFEAYSYVEHLVPSTKIVSHLGKSPAIHESVFVAPSANVIGQVTIGKGSSVWYGATLRGDVNKITIGQNTTIGDRAVVHVAKMRNDLPTNIGSHVTVGPRAVIHAATLEDESQVGAGAQVLDKAVVKKHAALAPGAVLAPGKEIPSGQLWGGVPAKFVRELTAEEIAAIRVEAQEEFQLACIHKEENAKHYWTVLFDKDEYMDKKQRSPDYFPLVYEYEDPEMVNGVGVPGRIFNSPLNVPLPGSDPKEKVTGPENK